LSSWLAAAEDGWLAGGQNHREAQDDTEEIARGWPNCPRGFTSL